MLEEGLLDEPALRQARRHARRAGIALSRAVVELRLLTDGALAEMLVRRLHLPRVDLSHEAIDDEAVREVPHDLADARRLLPLTIDRTAKRRVIRVAMSDPLDLDAVEEIEMSTGCELSPLIAPVGELADAIRKNYRGVITKMIPRKQPYGGTTEPTTQPNHRVGDEQGSALKLQALVALLAEKGVIEVEAFLEAVRKLAKAQSGE